MAYKLKKDHLTNWYKHEPNEKPTFNDDQDSYISERSSTVLLDEKTPSSTVLLDGKTPSPTAPKKQPHNLRYDYNALPENGIPYATQAKQMQKEEKQRIKNIRKAPPGQGNLVPVPETHPSEMGDNYYPYWRHYQATNPDYTMRHRQTTDGKLIPYEYVDPSQYALEPALGTPKKSHRHHRKSRRHASNPDKKPYETVRNDSLSTFHENSKQQKSPSNRHIPYIDAHHGEHSDLPRTQIRSHHRDKVKPENDWNNHYVQSMTSSKSSQDSNNISNISDISKHHHHHSKKTHNISPNENQKHDHTHHHHHSPSQSHHHHHHSLRLHAEQHHHHYSRPQPQHHHHHQPHRQHHHHSPSKEYVDSEFQVIDASFKKFERTPYFQPTQNPFHLPPPSIYNQSSYLPPITRDRPSPTDYYSTQTFRRDWKEPIKSPKIYKSDRQINFYDRYLNNIITEKIT